MKVRLLVGVLVGVVSVSQAVDFTPYVGMGGGVASIQTESGVRFDPGGVIEGAGGVGITGGIPIRTELAGSYQWNNISIVDGDWASGKLTSGVLMANLYFDIMDFSAKYTQESADLEFVPYFFGGIGAAFYDISGEGVDDDDVAFAANLGVGFGWYLTGNLVLDAKYKYAFGQDMRVEVPGSGDVKLNTAAHQVQVGFRYMF
jgi:opacity protein-like surface antigen